MENQNERAWSSSSTYSHIAYALARAYTDLFYVNMETDEYIEYYSDDERGMLIVDGKEITVLDDVK